MNSNIQSSEKASPSMRAQLIEFLPQALATALKAYQSFAKTPVPEEPAAFKSYHEAFKAAIAHIELLTKLAAWADLPDPGAQDSERQVVLGALVERAKAEVAAFRAKTPQQKQQEEEED